MQTTTKNLTEFRDFTKDYFKNLEHQSEHATVIALSGDLGVGKTTFSQIIAETLGVTETVQSPTFNIMKSYQLSDSNFQKLIHVDAYRLEDTDKIKRLGFVEDLANPENLILIEWPENIKDILPKNINTISFEWIDEGARVLTY